MTWRLKLKGKKLLGMGQGAINSHQLHLRSRISYPTVRKYIEKPGEVHAYNAAVLAGILIDGQGLSVAEVLELKIGDLFEIVKKD